MTPDVRNFDGDRASWNLELRQSIFRWENWATLKRANAEGAQAEADYVVAQQDLVLRTAEAYFNVLAARDTLEAGAGRATTRSAASSSSPRSASRSGSSPSPTCRTPRPRSTPRRPR